MESFRLLTEYHSFLFIIDEGEHLKANVIEFPSPYGVSFILIDKTIWERLIKRMYKVSVSLWSYIHFYTILKKELYHNKFLEYYHLVFLFWEFFDLFKIKVYLTPHFLDIIQLLSFI